ncbi:hypothetical protein [Pseudofrankia sp. BMG5.37]|uniref:hypothetical protein n=1 Tax=Pseudofrankia sp. BMG5.37 TaxID=3050035 RepID=UPI002894FEE2|nr:hypothetical protein [Pseudofrankia sp. BMG5.37]MDT3438728.1 hypothetical protein [Pseudofrankia sp. BMG5.37]
MIQAPGSSMSACAQGEQLGFSARESTGGSAHPDPHLRDIVWRRENALLALGTAASLAQLIFRPALRRHAH